MPVMDGLETVRTLRGNLATKDIPILAETALSRQADLNRSLQAGCND